MEQLKEKPQYGCYIYGLYMEGAAWDVDQQVIMQQRPKQLVQEMPLIQIIPIEYNKLKLKDSMKVPVYVT